MPKAVLAVVVIGVVAGLVLGGTALFYSLNATRLLIRAIERQNLAGVERAIWWGADVNHTWERTSESSASNSGLMQFPPIDISGLTPLQLAAAGDAEIVEALLRAGARVDSMNSMGDGPLHRAAIHGNGAVVRILLHAGAPVDASLGSGPDWTALYWAISFGGLSMVHQFLDAGADPNRPDPQGFAPVHMAARARHPAMLQALLAAGGDPHRQTDYGATPLGWASASGCAETVVLLLEQGVEVDARDDRGRTPLLHAINRDGIDDVLNLLLDAGADINVQDHEGVSALMEAARSGTIETLRLLLERGADPDLVDDEGMNALMHYESRPRPTEERVEVRALLEKFSTDRAVDEPRETPRRGED